MEDENIIEIIVKLTEEVENILNLKGGDKKTYVLSSLKSIIGAEIYNKHYFMYGYIIEFIIAISKGKRININRKNLFCCIRNKK